MEEFLDITPGLVSVMGHMNDHEKRVRLLIDQDVLEDEYVEHGYTVVELAGE